MTRRTSLSLLLYAGASVGSDKPDRSSNFLLISQAEIEAAKVKAREEPWAGAAQQRLLSNAKAALDQPVNVPDRGGQWTHWYSCKKDGVKLRTESPTRHVCPRCGTVYTGEPYDSVYLTFIHSANSAAMRDMALAFRFTGRKEFAEKTKDLLLRYGRKYETYALHDKDGGKAVTAGRVGSQTLDESVWVIPVTWAYALVKEVLSERERTLVESHLLRPATETIIGPSFDALSNIQCWKDSAVGCIGFALGDDRLISVAMDDPKRGFHALMNESVLAGGIWKEGSLGYQHYVLQALWPMAEGARRHGLDLYADKRYRSLFDGPVALALPDGESPGFNDNPGGSLARWVDVYELAYARWMQPEYGRVLQLAPRASLHALLYGAPRLPGGEAIPKRSVVLREAGFANLRSAHVSVASRFGVHGGGHGHPDMLDVVSFGYGKVFGLDPGSINYGVPLHREWYRTTIAHNTVCVDETNQSPGDGHFVNWEASAGSTKLVAEAAVYAGVRLRRELKLEGDSLIDIFVCESEGEHSYDWAFHSPGELKVSTALDARADLFSGNNGYQHVRDVKSAKVDEPWSAVWQQDGAKLTLFVEAAPGTVVITGSGPGRDPADMVPMLIIRRKGSTARFAVRHQFDRL